VIGSWKNVCGVLESPGKVLDFFLTKRVGTLIVLVVTIYKFIFF